MGDAEDARVSRFEGLGTARREKLEGIVGSHSTQLPKIATQVPNGTKPESRSIPPARSSSISAGQAAAKPPKSPWPNPTNRDNKFAYNTTLHPSPAPIPTISNPFK